jgi:hypothetical protein
MDGGAERTGTYSQRVSEGPPAAWEGGLRRYDKAPNLEESEENIMTRSFSCMTKQDLAISAIRKGTPVAESNIPHTKNDEL